MKEIREIKKNEIPFRYGMTYDVGTIHTDDEGWHNYAFGPYFYSEKGRKADCRISNVILNDSKDYIFLTLSYDEINSPQVNLARKEPFRTEMLRLLWECMSICRPIFCGIRTLNDAPVFILKGEDASVVFEFLRDFHKLGIGEYQRW